jgi:hypothetical protein
MAELGVAPATPAEVEAIPEPVDVPPGQMHDFRRVKDGQGYSFTTRSGYWLVWEFQAMGLKPTATLATRGEVADLGYRYIGPTVVG